MMSTPFIERPVATILLAIGLFLIGAVAFMALPVASLPTVDYPTIRVSASRPGADPEIMAATVAAPLERRLGAISGVSEITSSSGVGSTSIVVQFDLGRDIDAAARDIQAAINAASADLPSDLPSRPSFRKANPAAAPILILSMTADTLPPSALYDLADNILVQRLSQVEGVAGVSVAPFRSNTKVVPSRRRRAIGQSGMARSVTTTALRPSRPARRTASAMKPTWPRLEPAGARTMRWWLISSSSSRWSSSDRAHLSAGSPRIATVASGAWRRRSATAASSCANEGVTLRHPATVSASTITTSGRPITSR